MSSNRSRYSLYETLLRTSDIDTCRYLREMQEEFVVPFKRLMRKRVIESRLNEENTIDPDTYEKIMADVELLKSSKDISAPSLSDVVPSKLQQQYYNKIPDANASKPVTGFVDKIKTAVASVKDAASKKELLKLAKAAMKNPDMQSLALTAISGAAAASIVLATASPMMAGAVTGGLIGIARAKMAGKDWKSSMKAGAKGVGMGLAGGAIGGIAAGMASSLGHMMMSNTSINAPVADHSHHKHMEDMLGDLKQMAKDGKITDHASYEKALDTVIKNAGTEGIETNIDRDELDMFAGAEAASAHGGTMKGGSAAIEKAFVELYNNKAAAGFDKDIAGADEMRRAMAGTGRGNATKQYTPGVKAGNDAVNIDDFEESLAVAASLRMIREADDKTMTDTYLYQKLVNDGVPADKIKQLFDKWKLDIPDTTAKPAVKSTKPAPAASKPAPAAQATSKLVDTGDAALDKLISDKLSTEGKDAAIALAKELLAKEQKNLATLRAPAPAAEPTAGAKKPAAQQYGTMKPTSVAAKPAGTYSTSGTATATMGRANNTTGTVAQVKPRPNAAASSALGQGIRTRGAQARANKPVRVSESIPMDEYDLFDGNLMDILETASGGSTSAGSIASVANPMGGVISRTPNLFGYIPTAPEPKKRKNKRKSTR